MRFYSRIAEAIRNNLLQPGSTLPTETELGTGMKVSRTVVSEALMLLEEEGLIRAKCLIADRGHLSVLQSLQS